MNMGPLSGRRPLGGLAVAALLLAATNALAQGAASAPDIAGVWWGGTKPLSFSYVGAPPEMTPDGAKQFKQGAADVKAIIASEKDLKDIRKCRLIGMPAIWQMPYPIEIAQRPELVAITFEYQHSYRLVYMNEAPAKPADVVSTYTLGHAVGHWEGDTLVIEDTAFNAKGVLDLLGHPHTDDLHVVERLHKINGGKTLEVTATIEDPQYYRHPWTVRTTLQRRPDVRIQEFTCGYGAYDTRYTAKPLE